MVTGRSGVFGRHVLNSVAVVYVGEIVSVIIQFRRVTAGTVRDIQWRDKNVTHIRVKVSCSDLK